MPARSRDRPPGPSAESRRLCVRPAIGLVWSMNCDSWEVPKNSFSAATTGRMLIRDCGVIASTSWVVIRSRTTRSMRARPVRSWFWISSPTVRIRRLPKWSMSSAPISSVPCGVSSSVAAVVQRDDVADRGDDVVDGQRLLVERLVQAELLVDLVATDLGQVVALGVEVVVLQQRLRGLTRGRLARAQLAVDVEQRVVLALGVVLLQGQHHRLVRRPNSSRICSSVQPSALSSTVTFCLRLRSRRTPTMSRLSISNSSQAPRDGISLAV